LQFGTHSLLLQLAPEALESLVVQTLPQLPQLFGSEVVSEHALLQQVGALAPQPDPQPPQLFGSLVVSRHEPEQQVSAISKLPFAPLEVTIESQETPTSCHTPLELQPCGCWPLHCHDAGAQVTHAPFRHAGVVPVQGTALPNWPFDPHVWTALPAH
jgi:hypothetical protein